MTTAQSLYSQGDAMAGETDMVLDEATLRRRNSAKWASYTPDVLPAFVAEMDFKVAPAIQAAIEHVVRAQDYGYYHRPGGPGTPHSLAIAFARRMQARYGWHPAAELVTPVTDLVQGLYTGIQAFSEPGQGVVMQSPIYPPIRKAIAETGRRMVTMPTIDTGSRYVFDIQSAQTKINSDTRLLVLCNPHNPTGRVLSREELIAIADLAVERNLVVIADEIHADLVFDGAQHIPIASLGPHIAARTVTLNSATKSFNIPGLRTGVMHFGSAKLKARFDAQFPGASLGSVNTIGIAATLAAWADGGPWLDRVLTHLTVARGRLMEVLAAELPEVGVHCPEGTYLAWLDCRRLRLNTSACEFFHDHGKIALSAGENFEPSAEQFVRVNFATSLPILDAILSRLVDAAKRR